MSDREAGSGEWLLGKHAVSEALQGKVNVEKVVVAANIPAARWRNLRTLATARGAAWQSVPRPYLDKLTQGRGQAHQGIAARISPIPTLALPDLWAQVQGGVPFLLLLDGVQDPGNLGAILRTAFAAGVQGVVISKRRTTGFSQTVLDASQGAAAHLPIARVDHLGREIAWLKQQGMWVVGADLEAEETYDQMPHDATTPLALLVGGEGQGLRPSLAAACDFRYRIPMRAPISSLNVSVAAALFLYAMRRLA